MVWEIEICRSLPPAGNNIAAEITSLGNYFVSGTGRDVFALLEKALAASAEEQRDTALQRRPSAQSRDSRYGSIVHRIAKRMDSCE